MKGSVPFKLRPIAFENINKLHKKICEIEGNVPKMDIVTRWATSNKVINATIQDSIKRAKERIRGLK